MRITSWNVDGLARLLATNGKVDLQTVHRELGEPDVLCLQEVRLRPADTGLIAAASAALPGFVFAHALSDDPRNARFRGGRTYGVATYVRESLQPTWLDAPPWDREGRILSCRLPALGVQLSNVYAPNGTGKPYFQRDGSTAGTRSDFKLRFQRELLAYVRGMPMPQLLIGDWNVSRSKLDVYPRLRTEAPHAAARAMWNDELIPSLDLVDVFRALHGEQRAYTWFSRYAARMNRLDAARVDYALLSRTALPRVQAAGIAQEQAFALGSDHAPIWVELVL